MKNSEDIKTITEQTGFSPEEFNRAHRTGHIIIPEGPSHNNDYIGIDPMTGKPPRRMAGVDPQSVDKTRHAENVEKPTSTHMERIDNRNSTLSRE